MTPETPKPSRCLTRAREIYARYRGAADRWAVSSRPLDAPSPTRRRQMPLLLESLAWHYLTNPSLRRQLDLHELHPGAWRNEFLQGGQAFGRALVEPARPSPLPTGEQPQAPRTRRRWAFIWERALRQMRLTMGREPVCSSVPRLGNLEPWLRLRQGGLATKFQGYLAITDARCLAQVAADRPRRILFLCEPQHVPSLQDLSQATELPTRFIARLWPLTPQIYLPLCHMGRAHLPQPLLPLSVLDPGERRIWNTLAGEAKLLQPVDSLAELLIVAPGPASGCACGLGSWSISADCYKL